MRDLRRAFRALRRAPGFTLLTILTLGLAIGVNAGIFSVVETVLLDPLPYDDTDRLVYIAASAPGSDFPDEFGVAMEFYFQYREESELLEDVSTFNAFTNTLRAGDRIERVWMSAPTPSLFSTLGVDPIRGRLPTPEDEGGVVVISHALWTMWFGADEDILGRTLYVAGQDRTVIGVMPPDFWFPQDGTLLWFPNSVRVENIDPGRFGQPLVARMAPGVDREELLTELDELASRLPDRFGGTAAYARLIDQHRPVIRPLEEELLGDVAGPLWILLGSMGLLFVIACANVANLFLVRAERRQGDQAVRSALGAGRAGLIRGQLAETTVIAGLAGVVAVALAWAGTPLLVRVAPANVPRLDQVAIGPGTLLVTFAACVVSALFCGLAPALRFSAPNLARLREGGRGSMRRRPWGRNALVVAQTALSLVLLVGSALLLQSFDKLRDVDPGYDIEDVFTFQIAPEGPHLRDAESFARFHTDFMERVAALPGVESVGVVENVPLNEGLQTLRVHTEETIGQGEGALLSRTWAGGDYFRTMAIDVLRGRAFVPADHGPQPGHVLVSQSAADLLWPGEDPIGQRLQVQEQDLWETVVGVVDDVRQYGFRQPAEPMVYFPLVGQTPETSRPVSSPAYVVKTARADDIGPEIRALVREAAPTAPMYRVFTMEGLAADSMNRLSFTLTTLGLAALVALLLGLVGLYGVLSYSVAERTREIGLRMALGAEARRVQKMVVAQGARVVGIGIAIGVSATFLASRSLESLLFEVDAFEPSIYLGIAILMALVGSAASWLPALRASRVDPMDSLRAE